MAVSFDDAYQRYLNARQEKSDGRHQERVSEFATYTDTEKIDFLNNTMKENDVELFEYVLRTHDDVIHIRDEKESTLLHHAAINNLPFYVYILAKHDGIELDDYNYYDQTPLMLACTYGHKEVIKILLRYDYNVDLMDSIEVAHMSEREDVLEMLISEQEERQAMSMFRKIRRAQEDMKKTKFLHDYDECDDDVKKLSFMTKLMETNEMEMFKMVLETREDIMTARDEDGWTLLHNAVMNNHSTAVNILLNEDTVDIDAVDYCKTTPLMLACRSVRYKAVVEVLLEHGSDVLLSDSNGWNALDIAKRSKQTAIVELLLRSLAEKGLADTGKLAGEYFKKF